MGTRSQSVHFLSHGRRKGSECTSNGILQGGSLAAKVRGDLEAALKDQESLQCIGESAKSKALAWDEMAYGRRLLEILSTAVGG